MNRDGGFYIRQLNIFNNRAMAERLKCSVCRVYYILLDINNKVFWENPFRVSIRQISNMVCMDKNTVLRCVEELVDKGYIIYKPSNNRWYPSQFEIIDLRLHVSDGDKELCMNISADKTSVSSELIDANSDDNQIPTINFNTRLNEWFDQFWHQYPRRVKREEAKKAFIKLAPNDEMFSMIMLGLERQKKTSNWVKEDGRYIPYPGNWLKGRRWLDEMEPQESAQNNRSYIDF